MVVPEDDYTASGVFLTHWIPPTSVAPVLTFCVYRLRYSCAVPEAELESVLVDCSLQYRKVHCRSCCRAKLQLVGIAGGA